MIHHLVARFALAMAVIVMAMGQVFAGDEPAVDSPRIALVIGIGAYRTSPLPTAANDAGLMAQTLAAAGFDVTGARDLDGAALRRAIRDFLDKASAGGPRGVAFVYLAGHALQIDGENYFAPVDADLDHPAGAAIETFRIADLTHALASTNLGAKIVVIDGAHAAANGAGALTDGLALMEPEPGSLIAFNAAPGAVAPAEAAPFGLYAKTLTQTMKQGGVPVDEVFARLRVAMNTESGGGVTPWDASKLLQGFSFFDRPARAPAMGSAQVPFTSLRTRPLRDFSPEQAYDVALARDTLPAYEDYIGVFPNHPLARRVRQILALRREAMFWHDVIRTNSAPAYWTYLRRYPHAPHGAEAQRRLTRLAADKGPPPGFVPLAFDIAPPPEGEVLLIDRRGVVVVSDLPPPPPPPLFLLPPLPVAEESRQPPPSSPGSRLLPVPLAVAIPFVRPILAPGAIAPPRGVKGGYPHPRPFSAAAADGGLVPREIGDSGAATLIAPIQEPVAPIVPRPPKAPTAPVVPNPSAPAVAPPVAKAPEAGTAHRLPTVPETGTSSPTTPAPRAPDPKQPPAGSNTPHPITPKARPEPLPKGSSPPKAAPEAPLNGPAVSVAPLPALHPPTVEHPVQPRPVQGNPSAVPAPARPPRVILPKPAPVGVTPRPLGVVTSPQPMNAGQPRHPSPGIPAPAAMGAPPQAHTDQHRARPECGHPGQPACHP